MLAKRSNGWWWYGGKIFLHTTTSRGGTIMRTAQALHRVNNSKQLLTTKLKKVANISACFSWKTWSLFLHATLQSCNPNKFLEVKRSQNTDSWKWHMNAEHIYFDAILKNKRFQVMIEKQWSKNWFLNFLTENFFPSKPSLFLHARLQSCNSNTFLEIKRSQNTDCWKRHECRIHLL